MYTKGQMEAKEAEVAYWRTMSVKNHEELRDRFAMAALKGLLSHDGDAHMTRDAARICYDYADEMMYVRDIRRTSGTDSD